MAKQAALTRLQVRAPDSELVRVVIETPRGSRNKFKYDEELGVFVLDKVLPLGAVFPFDFGFLPSTRGEDGDPLDVLVLLEEAIFPGCVVPARLIGLLEAEQTERGKTVRNDRLVALPETRYNRPGIGSLKELGGQQLDEIEQFFVSYNRQEGREFKPLGRHGPKKAHAAVEEGMRNFQEHAR
jgi:inorganic pyrophosphatase